LHAYAELVLRMGINLVPGQNLLIDAQIEHAAFVRVLAEEGYRLGARYVDIWYWEPHGKRARVMYAPDDSLGWMPPWLNARYEQLVENGAALVSVRGDADPDLFNGLDPVRVGLDLMPAIPARIRAQQSSLVTWTIVACPTPGWAELVFGTPDVARLQSMLWRFMRLDQPEPVAAWRERIAALKQRAAALNECRFDAMRLKGPGTDLTVGLLPISLWGVADLVTRSGRRFLQNMPTEEVYTTPDPARVNGIVSCTRPLVLDGIVIRDLRLEIVDGRVMTVDASSGADVVRQHQATDDGAAFLGEIALVDGSSPIGQSGLTFFTTLLDENAACHLAWGSGIPTGIEGGDGMSDEELRSAGVNRSSVHVDFMVGAPDVEVLGVRANGETISVLRNLEWQID
jgi:aminopeptidase